MNATNTAFNNYYYNENKDVTYSAVVGAGFGFGGLLVGNTATFLIPIFKPIDQNISILLQNYRFLNSDQTSGALGGAASGAGSFIDTPDAKASK